MMKLASLASFILAASATADDNVTGDLDVWDDIFASRDYHILADAQANGLIWTEGPVLVTNNNGGGDEMLNFSDVIAAKTYSLDVDKAIRDRTKDKANNSDATTSNILDTYLHVIKERSGDAPQKDDNWRAEPGGNGLAVLSKTPRKLVMCQHGAQRVVILDVDSGTTHALASEYKGKKFNGPNDIVLRSEKNGELFAYFTDPVYAWLEKDRFEDLPYLDERVKSHGPGLCGVYRVKLTEDAHLQTNAKNEVELIASDMMRPNGIKFIDDDHLIVSECCQGSHLENCKSGTSRWRIFEQQDQESTSSSSWAHSKIIENTISADAAEGGCADGFALYEYVNREERRKHVLIGSCVGGMCIVDLESGEVVSRMWTTREQGGCKISNVAVGKEYAFLTGSCGILTLPLTGSGRQSEDTEASLHTEL